MAQVRETKKAQTRQRISDVATELFFERGFDAVTVDEVAVAAGVSKMTVFNYFARKEDLLLDREDDLKLLPFREAVAHRPPGVTVVDALRDLVRTMSAQGHPFVHVNRKAVSWWRVVDASPALKSRLRELAEEASAELATALGGPDTNGRARLAAGLIVLTLRTAREEAIRLVCGGTPMKKANLALLELIERGISAMDRVLSSDQTR